MLNSKKAIHLLKSAEEQERAHEDAISKFYSGYGPVLDYDEREFEDIVEFMLDTAITCRCSNPTAVIAAIMAAVKVRYPEIHAKMIFWQNQP